MDRTADTRTIFVKEDNHVDPHTGVKEEGHICKVCRLVSLILGFWFTLTKLSIQCERSCGKALLPQRWCVHSAYSYCKVGVVLILLYINANSVTSRHQDHFTVYENHCKKLNIPMHPWATPASKSSALKRYNYLILNITEHLLISHLVKKVSMM